MFRLALWLLIAMSGFTGVCAYGQEKPLKLSIRREWEGARSSAPLSLRVFSKWQRPELLEGRLHIQAFVNTQPISNWTSLFSRPCDVSLRRVCYALRVVAYGW